MRSFKIRAEKTLPSSTGIMMIARKNQIIINMRFVSGAILDIGRDSGVWCQLFSGQESPFDHAHDERCSPRSRRDWEMKGRKSQPSLPNAVSLLPRLLCTWKNVVRLTKMISIRQTLKSEREQTLMIKVLGVPNSSKCDAVSSGSRTIRVVENINLRHLSSETRSAMKIRVNIRIDRENLIKQDLVVLQIPPTSRRLRNYRDGGLRQHHNTKQEKSKATRLTICVETG